MIAVSDNSQFVGNRYQLGEKLGAGGMGTVYRATDRLTGDAVALKRVLLSPMNLELNAADNVRLSLSREFQTLATLRHPNIIGVRDYGFDAERQPYFTMSLIENAQTITRAGWERTLNERMRLLIEMLQALTYLHRRGILHRDLKPSNVLVTDIGQVKVLDFGLAISEAQDVEVGGTLRYIAPEVLNGSKPTFASDLYAVGVIAYEMLTGSHPFESPLISQLMHDVLHKQPDLSKVETAIKKITQEVDAAHQDDDPTTHHLISPAPDRLTVVDDADDATTQLSAGVIDRLRAQQSMTPARLPSVNSLVGVVAKLLEKDPTQRFQKAGDVIRALIETTGHEIPLESSEIRESFLQASTFVGRSGELGQLIDALDALKEQKGSAWLISGESGVGKSRLLEEIRIRALVEGALVLRGQAVAEGRLPYQLWRDVLRRLVIAGDLSDMEAGVFKAIVPDIDRLLSRPIPEAPTLDAKPAQQRLAATVIDVLARQSQPVVILLEDLHWAGESLEPLKPVLKAAADHAWLILASSRADEMPDLHTTLPDIRLMRLARLEDQAVEALSQAMLGDAGKLPNVLDLLKRETEGNTLFMVEIVRTLAEEAGSLEAIGATALPSSILTGGIQQILQRRLNRVPEWAQHALKLAAVIGRGIDAPIMDAYFRDQTGYDLDAWLTACANAAVFDVADGVWRFAHDKLRERLRADLNDDEQRELHAQAGKWLELIHGSETAYADALAEHWYFAGNAPRTLVYTEKAVQWMVAVTADYPRAQYLIERALPIIDEHPELRYYRAALYREWGELAEKRAQFADSVRFYEACITAAADDLSLLAKGLNGLARVSWRQGDYQRTKEVGLKALEAAQAAGDKRTISQVLSSLSTAATYQGDFAQGQDYLEQVLSLNRELNDSRGLASAFNNLAIISLEKGEFDAARADFERAFQNYQAIGDRSGVAVTLNNLGLLSMQRGSTDDARSLYEQSLVIRRQILDTRGIALTTLNLAEVEFLHLRYEQAERYLQESIGIYRQIGDRRGITLCLTDLSSTALAMENTEKALHYAQEALALCRELGDKRGTAVALNVMIEVQAEIRAFAQARDCIIEAKTLSEAMNTIPTLLETLSASVRLLHREGEPENAVKILGMVRAHPSTRNDVHQAHLQRIERELIDLIGEAKYQAALEAGRTLSIDSAFTLILPAHAESTSRS
ncbi:MAG: tetratricopeptide repeat protein [Anaerolineae bacterium]